MLQNDDKRRDFLQDVSKRWMNSELLFQKTCNGTQTYMETRVTSTIRLKTREKGGHHVRTKALDFEVCCFYHFLMGQGYPHITPCFGDFWCVLPVLTAGVEVFHVYY